MKTLILVDNINGYEYYYDKRKALIYVVDITTMKTIHKHKLILNNIIEALDFSKSYFNVYYNKLINHS